MNLYITGFLINDTEDSSLQFDLDIPYEHEKAVMDILGWKDLTLEADGDLPLKTQEVQKISAVLGKILPEDLELFIGVISG